MRSWMTGKCRECYYEVVVTQPDNDNFPYDDYQWYCSNPKCKNHDTKIHTGDMEHPEWVELNQNKDDV